MYGVCFLCYFCHNPNTTKASPLRLSEEAERERRIAASAKSALSCGLLFPQLHIITDEARKTRDFHFLCPSPLWCCKNLSWAERTPGQFVNQAHPHGKALQRVVQKINENVNKNFKVSELAREAGMSESYFRAMFKSYSGYSVVQYQNFIKISYARDLLLSGNYRVNEVAAAVGISDVYYFSRLFTKIVGTNPSSLFQ